MWKIEIRDLNRTPAKVRLTYFSKLPTLEKLQRMDRCAIMSRVSAPDPACSSCKRVVNIAAHIKRQQDIRAKYGANLVLFPLKELVS